jgi:hypothetical protein
VYYPPDAGALTPTPAPATETCNAAHLGGITAGIVISILVGIATLVFAVWNWRMLRGSGSTVSNNALKEPMYDGL